MWSWLGSWFPGSSGEARPSPLKGKLDSLEMRNAVTGAEIAKSAFGPILEVTCRKENFVGHCLDESLVTEDTQKALFDNFPCECTRIYCLDHTNVAKLRGVVIPDNSLLPILVTEKLGTPLTEYLLEKHAEPSEQLGILGDIARGLQYLHGLQTPVLHLCLTPENIALTPDTLQAKICNAGVVNLLQLTPSWCRTNLHNAQHFLPQSDATTPEPSVDIFSYGALMIHVFQPQPELISPPVFLQDTQNPQKIIMDSFVTVDKVMAHGASAAILCKVLATHPMYGLIQKCLMKKSIARPTATQIVEELENSKESAVQDMTAWEKDIDEKTRTWLRKSNCLTVTVIGRTGTGKTSLMNGLLGETLGKEGHLLSRGTAHVRCFESKIQGVNVILWDTPGLQDGVCNDEEYLQEMITSRCVNANLKLYCISMTNSRFEESEMKALGAFTTTIGTKFWEHCMFVLTFANGCASLCPLDTNLEDWFGTKIRQFKERIKSELLKVGVDESVVKQINIVPAGYHQPTQAAPNPWKLPGIENWFYTFWYTCADVIDPSALPALVKANQRRFKQSITESDLRKSIVDVPLPYLKQGAIVAGAGAVGIGGAAGVGALVGAVVGAVGGPIGAAVGAEAGAVVGMLTEPLLLWAYMRYQRGQVQVESSEE